MGSEVVFHRLVRTDMSEIRRYYAEEAGTDLADRFYAKFLAVVEETVRAPARCHPANGDIRRAAVKGFPYHFLFRETDSGIRILVLRHDMRHPSFGLSRR